MEVIFINSSQTQISEKSCVSWVETCLKLLAEHQVFKANDYSELTLVFQDPEPAKALNLSFRNKGYATDILSFAPVEEGSLGELVVCPDVVVDQAKDQNWSFQEELNFMILHGILHLLGFDHETSKEDEKVMFELQDKIYKLACEV